MIGQSISMIPTTFRIPVECRKRYGLFIKGEGVFALKGIPCEKEIQLTQSTDCCMGYMETVAIWVDECIADLHQFAVDNPYD